ncbi:GSCOCG00005892001-RA-CDS [Cotesia congregata]|uniref:polyribonucleotide nucleotidyltransferase n=1 Tax=Cotesia congregata TaxID=51543 RepID=A0A8J2HQ64_COTCN|nr:GSCOCG00005892001-RA-CDS [Cotesia congregata]CAG5106613.1 Similar to PNPT1: Polyribonucleotide nucleotidyltransferase 1 [Cotesia congregata]
MAYLVNLRLILNNKVRLLKNYERYRKKIQVRSVGTDWSTAEVDVPLGDGKKMVISTGKLAKMASGSAMVSSGKTSVMVTSVCKTQASSSSFMPLIVDYRLKASATGRIPTNFLRRELGSTEYEITAGRLIDRTVRPSFPKGFCYETQLITNTFMIDGENLPDVLAINAASASLALSDIPWNGPVAAVRVGFIDNDIVINPTNHELQHSSLNLIVSAANNNMLVMMDGYANMINSDDLKKSIQRGVLECQEIINAIKKLAATHGKPKRPFEEVKFDEQLLASIKSLAEIQLRNIFTDFNHDKISRDNAINNLRTSIMETMKKSVEDLNLTVVVEAFNIISKEVFRELIFETNQRCDGRKLDELRDIKCEAGHLELLHGSALFQRGQTQVSCSVTLDSLDSALKMDMVSMLTSGVKEKNFFLHYEFPPYAINEVGRAGVVGRREMGHGALAERGLRAVIPEDYPFTIRLMSEVLESNGSSSMASVCGGSLALLDAGVPISQSVAGVAIGLVTKYDKESTSISDYRILTDLLGIEDYLGDMDFKIAGPRDKITAIQADIKLAGLPVEIVEKSIDAALEAKKKILDIMDQTLATPRSDKFNLPLMDSVEVPVHLRGQFLGVGGYNLKKIYLKTGVTIQPQDDKTYSIFAPNETAMKEAKEMIDVLLKDKKTPEMYFGEIYQAKIVQVKDSGVMVILYDDMKPVFVPNSHLDQTVFAHPSARNFEVGQMIKVKYLGREAESGAIRLSSKVLRTTSSSIRSRFK